MNVNLTEMNIYSTDGNGESFIPASQRPDGTWRKPRRVKEGYVPQEEVPLYESKGKQAANRQAKPLATTEPLAPGQKAHQTIPGLFISQDKEKSKKKKSKPVTEEVVKKMSQMKIKNPEKTKIQTEVQGEQDPAKKLKNLKKRLREVEALEVKIASGTITTPEPDQLAKLKRKEALKKEIQDLEDSI